MKRLKRFLAITLLVSVLSITVTGCSEEDPLEEMWTQDIFPGSVGNYSIGNETNPYYQGFFDGLHVGELFLVGGNLEVQGDSYLGEMLVRADGTMQPASMADASTANNSIYYSTTQGKLVYKDASGVVNNLY